MRKQRVMSEIRCIKVMNALVHSFYRNMLLKSCPLQMCRGSFSAYLMWSCIFLLFNTLYYSFLRETEKKVTIRSLLTRDGSDVTKHICQQVPLKNYFFSLFCFCLMNWSFKSPLTWCPITWIAENLKHRHVTVETSDIIFEVIKIASTWACVCLFQQACVLWTAALCQQETCPTASLRYNLDTYRAWLRFAGCEVFGRKQSGYLDLDVNSMLVRFIGALRLHIRKELP